MAVILAPPPVQALEAQVAALVSRYVAPVPSLPISVGVDPIPTMTPGYAVYAQNNGDSIGLAQPLVGTSFLTAETLLHENLHSLQGAAAYSDGSGTQAAMLEEALVQSVSVDLLPQLKKTLRSDAFAATAPGLYPRQVTKVRLLSALACQCRWTAPSARRWRVTLLLAAPVERQALLASLIVVPT
jgi:hypothetical protein